MGEVQGRESLRGQKAQESICPRPGLTLWVARRGTAFEVGDKPLERRYQADGLGRKAQEWRVNGETRFHDHLRGEKLWRVKPESVEG